ncbi:hypothetical protein [Miltoncostaea marina]|uniref:hypothetical protein n=1 Tax=Miltoncostaea marina TaxID=2843215 RepID=UPI001C3E2148|nr:hypothetical protein [Miltoncostaea marina]
MARARNSKKKTGGRRANYAPAPTEVGTRRYLPIGWANWLGFIMFGLISIALFAETIAAIAQQRGADPVAAAVMTGVFGTMTYLFATTRVKD